MLLQLLLQRLRSWLFCLAVLFKENLTSDFLQVEQTLQVFWARSDPSGKCGCLKINDFLISSSSMEHLLLQNISDPFSDQVFETGWSSFSSSCYRISTSLNKEAWRQPIKVQYHRPAVQHTLLFSEFSGNEARAQTGHVSGSKLQCLRARCSWEEEEEKQADSAPFISYDYLKPCGAGSAWRAVAPNGRNTNTSVGGERIPRCWSTLGPHSRQGTNSGWCWGIRPPRKASSGQRTGRGHHHTLDTNVTLMLILAVCWFFIFNKSIKGVRDRERQSEREMQRTAAVTH